MTNYRLLQNFYILLATAISVNFWSCCIPLHAIPLDHDQQAQLHRWNGIKFESQYDYADAVPEFQLALTLDRTFYTEDASLDLNRIAGCYFSTSHYPEALNSYQDELLLEDEIGDRTSIAITLSNIGLIYDDLGQYKTALHYYQKALLLMQQSDDLGGMGKALANIGSVYDDMGQHTQAMLTLSRALPLQQISGDRDGEAATLGDIGSIYDGISAYAKASDYYQHSLRISVQVGDRRGEATMLNNLGLVYRHLSQYAAALQSYQEALPILQQIGDRDGEAVALNNIGNVYDDLSSPAPALDYYRRALRIEQQVGDRDAEGSTYLSIGLAYDGLGRREVALESDSQAMAIFKETGNIGGEATELSNVGSIYTSLNRYRSALSDTLQALAIRRQSGDRADEGLLLNNLGGLYDKEGLEGKALGYYERALPISREVGDEEGEAVVLVNMMVTCRKEGHPGLAVFYGKQAVNLYQHIRTNIGSLDLERQRGYLAANQDAYRTLADLLIGLGRLPEAQQVLGLLKEQELFEFLRGAPKAAVGDEGVSLTPEEAEQEETYDRIADQVTALGQRQQLILDKIRTGNSTPDDQAELDGTRMELSAAAHHLNRFLSQLTDTFDSAAPASFDLSARVQAMKNAAGLQDTLRQLHDRGQDVVVLETVVTRGLYAVIVTTAQSQKVEKYPIREEDLNSKVAAFQTALRDPSIDPRPSAAALYKIIFAPIEKDVLQSGATTLMWSLDGTLRYVPIAALYDGKQYLVERFDNEVFTLGSQSGFEEDEHQKWEGLGLGVSRAHSYIDPVSGLELNFPALSAVPAELDAIIESDSSKDGVVPGDILLDPQFTQAAMIHALELQKYNVVHIASHFALAPGDPDNSFLLLGDGSRLSLAQLADDETLFQGVDLLALSACDTAAGGPGLDGKEVDSLGTIAQEDGAKSVLASLWPVSDYSTRLLMQRFYSNHESGPRVNKAEALRLAQLSLLHGTIGDISSGMRGTLAIGSSSPQRGTFVTDPKAPYSHPFFWAPFILIGNWR